MNKNAIIKQLNLEPHLEGGYFRRSYESTLTTELPTIGQRLLMSSIYYMLTDDSPIGFFHRNQSDIVHYWHSGRALHYYLIDPQGSLTTFKLGPDILAGEHLQMTVPGGYWKATVLEQGDYGLLSEAVAPGFDYDDMTLASEELLQQTYSLLWQQQGRLLTKFCKS